MRDRNLWAIRLPPSPLLSTGTSLWSRRNVPSFYSLLLRLQSLPPSISSLLIASVFPAIVDDSILIKLIHNRFFQNCDRWMIISAPRKRIAATPLIRSVWMGLITKSLICRRMCPPKDQTLRFAHTHSVHSCISLFSIPCFVDCLLLLVFLFSSTFFLCL